MGSTAFESTEALVVILTRWLLAFGFTWPFTSIGVAMVSFFVDTVISAIMGPSEK
jgi:hypothetical protein